MWDLDPNLKSYEFNDEGFLVSKIVDFGANPFPCQCGKCARDTLCICRINKGKCCNFCISKQQCNNPNKRNNQNTVESSKPKGSRHSNQEQNMNFDHFSYSLWILQYNRHLCYVYNMYSYMWCKLQVYSQISIFEN